jgi:hypothetical protein
MRWWALGATSSSTASVEATNATKYIVSCSFVRRENAL